MKRHESYITAPYYYVSEIILYRAISLSLASQTQHIFVSKAKMVHLSLLSATNSPSTEPQNAFQEQLSFFQ